MKAATRLAVILSGVSASVATHAASAQILVPVPEARKTPIELLSERIKASKPEAVAAAARESVASLIANLDDPSITVRQEAERSLSGIAMTQAQLEEAIQNPTASPEQRLRLERLGPSVLYHTPRAAVGITFSQTSLEVGQMHEGFDSQRVLQVGDQIVSVGGHQVYSPVDLRPAIVMHSPGADVTMRVVRQGRPLTLRLKLGDFDALPSRGWRDSVTFEDCQRAWKLRTSDLQEERRQQSKSNAILDVGVDAAGWERLRQGPGNTSPDPTTMPWGDLTLTAGGSPRESGGGDRDSRPTLTVNWDRAIGGLGVQAPQRDMKRIEEFQQKIFELQRKLAGNDLDAAAKAKVLAEMQELSSKLFEDMDVPAPGGRKP